MKTIIAAVVAVAFSVPALAQTTTTEFYVVHEPSTKKCTVVDKRPTTTTTTVVDGRSFKTRVEAETAVKTMKVCTTN